MMELDFANQTAIVTGASGGIGQAIAQGLLASGAKVIATGYDTKPAWCQESELCEYEQVDFLDNKSVGNLLSRLNRLKQIDVLVNSAGIHIPKSFFSLNDDDWDRVLGVNLFGPMRVIRVVAEKMKKAKNGRIVNISSIAGLVSRPTSSAYSASKSGLIGLTRAIALELGQDNVLINALCPGTTETEMTKSLLSEEQTKKIVQGVPLARLAQPNEIAAMALFLCSKLNTYMTGQTIVVDGGSIIQ